MESIHCGGSESIYTTDNDNDDGGEGEPNTKLLSRSAAQTTAAQQVLEGDASLLQSTSARRRRRLQRRRQTPTQSHSIPCCSCTKLPLDLHLKTKRQQRRRRRLRQRQRRWCWSCHYVACGSLMRARMPHTRLQPVLRLTTTRLSPSFPLPFSFSLSLFRAPLPSFNFQHAANFVFMQQISISCYKITRTCTRLHARDCVCQSVCVCLCVCNPHVDYAADICLVHSNVYIALPLAFATLLYFGIRLFRCFVAVSHTSSPSLSLFLSRAVTLSFRLTLAKPHKRKSC